MHRRIIVKVQAAIHQTFTTESQEIENIERDYMLNTLQEKVMEEGYRVLGKERVAELNELVHARFKPDGDEKGELSGADRQKNKKEEFDVTKSRVFIDKAGL